MALPDTFALTVGVSRASGITSASLTAGANYLGSAIDNSTNLDLYADIEIVWSCSLTPTADAVLEVYLLYSLDGTNYEDGSTSVDPKAPMAGAAPVYADTATHRYLIRGVSLEPLAFKALVKSEINQAATVTVNIITYREQVVD
jgi:hypothetical protein